MTCLSNTSPIPIETHGPFWTSLRAIFEAWRRREANRRSQQYLVWLSDRELRDLAIQRDWIAPPRPSELGRLWP